MDINNTSYITPGTVSKILWHFTGGPIWDEVKKKQKDEKKSDTVAYDNLYKILKTKELLIGKYKEIINYIIPKRTVFDVEINQTYVEENIPDTFESKEVCCMAEIPIQHLSYHAKRYGKFAIGFYRDSLINKFNPVLYTTNTDNLIYHIFRAYQSSGFVSKDIANIPNIIDSLLKEIIDNNKNPDIQNNFNIIKNCIKIHSERLKHVENVLKYVISFIKTISIDEFETVYCEREWRSTESFKFNFKDIAFIIIPKSFFQINEYNLKIDTLSNELNIPRSIPIVPWEDLVEH